MGIAVTEEERALASAVRAWAAGAGVTGTARSAADGGASPGARPVFWADLARQGFLAPHLPERHGGGGAGLVELAIVVEELGRAAAPGPHLGTALAGLVVSAYGEPSVQDDLLPRLADGTATGAVAIGTAALSATADADGWVVEGTLPVVLDGAGAAAVVAPVALPGGERWVVLDSDEVTARATPGADPGRCVAEVTVTGVHVGSDRLLTATRGDVEALAGVLLAAEAAGVAGWCLDTAVAYAKVREQFGRPIGAFQAVKHRCADMLAKCELAVAAAWDAARAPEPLPVAVAVPVALDAAVDCATSCIQVLGGIGYTWEHDAHLYLKRAVAARALAGGTSRWRQQAARLALGGVRRLPVVELPPEEDAAFRAEVRAFLAELADVADPRERERRVADAGYLVPHWPRPWGRDAGAVEQLVVDEEFAAAGVARRDLVIGSWALATIIAHGTDAQRVRFVRRTLYGEITWCQMFSEPGAGSDLASLQTKAVRTQGGWLLSGQKVWTSLARSADWAICLARTDTTARRHEGITYFLVDVRAPGIDVRPLRELTGEALFNEVFLTDVFVPDDQVVGAVGGGWPLARTTLANERVAMSSGAAFPSGVQDVLDVVAETGQGGDPAVLDRVGALVAAAQAESALGVRMALLRISGTDPGAASSVRKLVGMHHRQDASALALDLLGEQAATGEGAAAARLHRFLANRALTIAGGTSEVLRNVIGERVLGLPRN